MANQYYRPDQDIYSMLGLPPDTPREVVYSTARQAMLRHHPDQGGDPYAFRWCKWAADLAGQEFFWGLWSQERAAYWRSPLRRLFRRPSAPVSLAPRPTGEAARPTVTGGPVPMAIPRAPGGPGQERPHVPHATTLAVISTEALATVRGLPWGAWHVLARRLVLTLRRAGAEAEDAWVSRLQAWAAAYLARQAEARRRKAAARLALRYIAMFEKEAPQWMQMHGGKLTKTYTEKKHRTVPAANGKGTKTITYTVQTKVALFRGFRKKHIRSHDDVLWEMHLLPIYPHISDVVHDSDTAQIHDRWERLIFDEKNLRELVDQPDLGHLNAKLEVTTKSHYLVVRVRDAQAPAVAPEEPAPAPEPEALRPGGPPLALLAPPRPGRGGQSEGQRAAQALQAAISSFGFGVTVSVAGAGPTVIRLALRYPPGIPASRIAGRAGDLVAASNGALTGLRFVPPGLEAEVVRQRRDTVALRSLLASPAPRGAALAIPVGADASGRPVLADLSAAPHVLCAGATGGGKSVWLHTVLLGLLARYTPAELRIALIDPKQVELAMYGGLPHLLAPIATAPEAAIALLDTLRAEMERRYGVLRAEGARDIASYNDRHPDAPWPRVVCVVDETYDLRLGARDSLGREGLEALDGCLTSLAQKARAAGIHLVITTQKPTVDAVPSILRGNLPCRMALRVTTQAESGVALDRPGAEMLAGKGDGLWLGPGAQDPVRVQSGFVSEDEIAAVVGWCTTHDPDPGPLFEPTPAPEPDDYDYDPDDLPPA